MNDQGIKFQPYNLQRKQFAFLVKPRLSIQQLDIKFNKNQRKEILHRRKSEITFQRRQKIKTQKMNQEQENNTKLPMISKKIFQLQISQAANTQNKSRRISPKKLKKTVNFLQARSLNLLKRSISNIDNYQHNVENEPNNIQIEMVEQINQQNLGTAQNSQEGNINVNVNVNVNINKKKIYISDLNLESIENKDQLNRRLLISKLLLKKQEEQKICGTNFNFNLVQSKLLKNIRSSLNFNLKQSKTPDQILSKKLQINPKKHKIRLIEIKKPSIQNKLPTRHGFAVQGWQTDKYDEMEYDQ